MEQRDRVGNTSTEIRIGARPCFCSCLMYMSTRSPSHLPLTIGKLSLIDLAGSERATVTDNRGIRMMEATTTATPH